MEPRRIIQGATGSVVLDTRQLPIVFIQWHGVLDVELGHKFAGWLDGLLAQLEAEQRVVVLIVDLRETGRPSPEFRRLLSALHEQQREQLDRWVLRDVMIINSRIMRGVLATLQWLTPSARMASVPDMVRAIDRARLELERVGVVVPDLEPRVFDDRDERDERSVG